MHKYIIDTEYAACGLINLITDEEKQLMHLEKKLVGLRSKEEHFRQSSIGSPFNDGCSLQEQARVVIWHKTYPKLIELEKERAAIQKSIETKSDSIAALCAALLQVARQGISVVYQGLQNCPCGRAIGSEKLKNVIWQARNQSMHYEEGVPRGPVRNCFSALESSFDDRFSLSIHVGQNLAHNVIDILDWKEYSQYKADLNQLLREV